MTLYDDFTGTTLDTAKWPTVLRPELIALTNGRLRTYMGSNQSGQTYTEVRTPPTINLTGNWVGAHRATLPPHGIPGVEFSLTLRRDSANFIAALGVNSTGNALVARVRNPSQSQQVITITAADNWWRIREAGGTIHFETSTDGDTWTGRHSTPAPFALDNLTLAITAGYYGTGEHEDKFMEWGEVHISGRTTPDPEPPVADSVTVRAADGTALTPLEWDGTTGHPLTVREWAPGGEAPGPSPPTGELYDNGLPRRVFSDESFWYQPLPDDTPLDPQSAQKVQNMITRGINAWGNPGMGWPSWTINTQQYSPPIWVTSNADPAQDITYDPAPIPGKPYPTEFVEMMKGTRIPAHAVPANGTDAEVVFWNQDTDEYVDLWYATKNPDGTWKAAWGMKVQGARQNIGIPPVAPSGIRYGTIAAGLAVEGGTIKAQEFAEGEITHAIGMAVLVGMIDNYISAPAVRTDGNSTNDFCVSMGQRFRLPASLDLDTPNYNPATRTFAKAVQKYGLIVWDRAGALSFRAENPLGVPGTSPYARPNGLFGSGYDYDVLWGAGGFTPFPWSQLQVLALDYMP